MYVPCSSYANTQHGNYIVLTSSKQFHQNFTHMQHKEFAIGMTSYLPVHNDYTAYTSVSKDKKTLAYLPAGACKIVFEYTHKCLY